MYYRLANRTTIRFNIFYVSGALLLISSILSPAYGDSFSGLNSSSSARIHIRLTIPPMIKLQATVPETGRPASYLGYRSPTDMPAARFCFRQRGVPSFQLLLNHQPLPDKPSQKGGKSCQHPFEKYTADQLQQLAGLSEEALILTVSPL